MLSARSQKQASESSGDSTGIPRACGKTFRHNKGVLQKLRQYFQ